MGRERRQGERHLILLVTEFARMERPLDSATVLRHFVRHPWFGAPVAVDDEGWARVIFGAVAPAPMAGIPLGGIDLPGGTVSCYAVSSLAVLPQSVFVAQPPVPPSSLPRPGDLIPTAAFEADQQEVRALLRACWCWDKPARKRVAERLAAERRHPDLAVEVDGRPVRWLATIQRAYLLAVELLAVHQVLRDDLRWCEDCDLPSFPTPSVGRPSETCPTCGKLRHSHRQRRLAS